MPTSLLAPDLQSVLAEAVNPPNPAAAAFASPDWRARWDQEVVVAANTNLNQSHGGKSRCIGVSAPRCLAGESRFSRSL